MPWGDGLVKFRSSFALHGTLAVPRNCSRLCRGLFRSYTEGYLHRDPAKHVLSTSSMIHVEPGLVAAGDLISLRCLSGSAHRRCHLELTGRPTGKWRRVKAVNQLCGDPDCTRHSGALGASLARVVGPWDPDRRPPSLPTRHTHSLSDL